MSDPVVAAALRRMGVKPENIPGLLAGAKERGKPLGVSQLGHRLDIGKTIFLTLHAGAMGKPRMTQRDKWKQRPAVVRYRAWCDQLRAVAGAMPEASRVMELNWKAVFVPPTSWSKKTRVAAYGELHRSKFDADNISKAICDCLWPKDDSGIAAGAFEKRWGPKAVLSIEVKYI